MAKFLTRLIPFIFCILFTVLLRAQVTSLYLAGGSWSPAASPAFAGSALYAHRVAATGTYAFTMVDAVPETVAPFLVSTNIGIGVAQKIVTIAGVPIFVPSAAGISLTGTNTGWAWTTGLGAPIQIRKTNWYCMPTIRMLKSSVSGGSGYQPILGVLIGWGQ